VRRSFGIAHGVALASGGLALVLVVEFVLLVLVIAALRTSIREGRHSDEVVATATALEKATLDLETGQRGFVISLDPAFLEPLRSARKSYPGDAHRLESFVRGEPAQERQARDLEQQIRDYDRSWTARILTLARSDPEKARAFVAAPEGKRRVDAIRAEIDRFIAAERQRSKRHGDRANHLGTIAIGIGIGALVATLALLALYTRLAFGFLVAPIGRLVGATRALAGGHLDSRASDERAIELGQLAREFNAMADALALRRAELESVLDSTRDGLLMADGQGEILFANRAMEAMWRSVGISERGSIWDRVIALAQLTGHAEEYADVFEGLAADPEAEYESEFAVPSQGRAFVGRTAPVHDEHGHLLGRIFILREVTREREAERLKDEFVATVSHELRTPLTSIRGFVELLQAGEGGDLTPDQRRFLAVVDRNSDRLLHLVGDLLLIAQLDANTLRLEPEELDVADLAVEAVESARPSAEEAGLRLELLVDDAPRIRGDRARLAQLVDNLVANAIKFTPSGGIVEVAAGARHGTVTLSVRDTGPGMSSEELGGLFERFYRTRRAAERQVPGTGLGLAISRAIAEAHGGTITVSSRVGVGTTFTLELPSE
jgi:signal transduction histidine kinase/CHASE3 domain sensor protein